jgi:membrane-associated phospholipid phosphatase
MSRLVRPRQRPMRRVPAVLIGGLSASLASIFLFGKISDEILEREAMAFDSRLVQMGRKIRKPELDRVMSVATSTGEPWALALVSGLVGLIWVKKRRFADIVTLLLAVAGGGAVNQVLKTFFRRDRPALRLRRAHASGYSYPSGHAMTTLASYGTLAFLISRHGSLTKRPEMGLVWVPTLALCALVGCSRVYLEVHYPTDVIGGWAVGTVWLTTCGIARSFMEPEES